MGQGSKDIAHRNLKALLLVGALYAQEELFLKAKERLIKRYGDLLLETAPRPWIYTDYYIEELGPEIIRRFLVFREPMEQGELAGIKIATNAIEKELSEEEGRRTVNLDPGYITPAKLVLASTKDYSHRVYLGDGIFAEVTLSYVKDGFKPFPYTYRDYLDPHYLNLFNDIRERAKKILS